MMGRASCRLGMTVETGNEAVCRGDWGRGCVWRLGTRLCVGETRHEAVCRGDSLAWPDPIPHRGKGSGIWPYSAQEFN